MFLTLEKEKKFKGSKHSKNNKKEDEMVKVKGYKCNNCGYEWLPRSQKEKPLICPKCKSARWDKEPRNKKH